MTPRFFLILITCSIGSLSIQALASPDDSNVSRSLEGRWNTALLRTFDVDDSFIFLGEQASVISNFTWTRCEDFGTDAGAHPTYRGGTREAYEVAEKILRFVNSDRRGSEQKVTLDDINISCNQ
jgi:hypothetical protein